MSSQAEEEGLDLTSHTTWRSSLTTRLLYERQAQMSLGVFIGAALYNEFSAVGASQVLGMLADA